MTKGYHWHSVVGMTLNDVQEFVVNNQIPLDATIDCEGDLEWWEDE